VGARSIPDRLLDAHFDFTDHDVRDHELKASLGDELAQSLEWRASVLEAEVDEYLCIQEDVLGNGVIGHLASVPSHGFTDDRASRDARPATRTEEWPALGPAIWNHVRSRRPR
jgi:hypothetical protein